MNTLVELSTRVLCDSRPNTPVDGVYLYCQTKGNQHSVFQAASSLLNQSLAAKVLILQSTAKSGYPGFDKWYNELQGLGVFYRQIEGVAVSETESLNTLIESEAVVKFALQHKYNSIFIVAPPFQQLRAFMTAVTVALREYPQLLIYSYPAVAEPWLEEVFHSQGTLKERRKELIHAEMGRIDAYQKKGDLALPGQVLDYLNNRQDVGLTNYSV